MDFVEHDHELKMFIKNSIQFTLTRPKQFPTRSECTRNFPSSETSMLSKTRFDDICEFAFSLQTRNHVIMFIRDQISLPQGKWWCPGSSFFPVGFPPTPGAFTLPSPWKWQCSKGGYVCCIQGFSRIRAKL